MFVYRVQRKGDGAGPYVDSGIVPHAGNEMPRDRRLPVPWADGIYRPAWPNRFGFSTLRQLRYWFNKADREHLSRLGYLVCRYRLKPSPETCVQGWHQVVFNPCHAEAPTPLDIVTLRKPD